VASVLQFAKVEDGIRYKDSKEPCVGCGKTFQHAVKRGRPPVRCIDCQSGVDAAKAAQVTVSEEVLESLYTGDKFLLQGTPDQRPKVGSAEAQCPTTGKCGRIFTSNSACDDHKRWLPNGSYDCIDPATLGMEPRERRGIPVWTRPTPADA